MAVYGHIVSEDALFWRRMKSLDAIINENLKHVDAVSIVCESYGVVLEGEKWDSFKQKVKDIIDKIIQKIKDFIQWIKDKVKGLIDKIRGKNKKPTTTEEVKKKAEEVEKTIKTAETKVNSAPIPQEEKSEIKEILGELYDEFKEQLQTKIPVSAYDVNYMLNIFDSVKIGTPTSKDSISIYTIDDVLTFADKVTNRTIDGVYNAYISTFTSASKEEITIEELTNHVIANLDKVIRLIETGEDVDKFFDTVTKICNYNYKALHDLRKTIDITSEEESEKIHNLKFDNGRGIMAEAYLTTSVLLQMSSHVKVLVAQFDECEDMLTIFADKTDKYENQVKEKLSKYPQLAKLINEL